MTSDVYDPLVALYGPRLMALAKEIRAGLTACDLTVTAPEEWNDEDYSAEMLVRAEGRAVGAKADDGDIDIQLILVDAEKYEGDENAVCFSLDIIGWGGRVITHYIPFNFTDKFSVDPRDAEAVEERWRYFAEVVANSDLAGRIREWRETRQ